MCGIAVAIGWNDANTVVQRLVAGIAHRGDITDPIQSPFPRTAMGTRRLRIVDAQGGVQPQMSFDGRLLVSFNGEIYNHVALRREMEAQGVPFRSQSDTEVLANALQTWGMAALQRISGMFAFVAVDAASGNFLAARDLHGVKPLYLIRSGSGFLFCSEMAPLLNTVDTGDVMLLPPGHFLTRDLCAPFQSLPFAQQTRPAQIQCLDELLDQAVESRLPADLPVALLFSGGIDSTLLAHYVRRHRPGTPGYFIGSPNAPDLPFARAYAHKDGMELREINFTPQGSETLTLMAEIAATVEAFEPVAVRPGVYSFLLSRRIHEDGYRVALCGEGADELFAGYPPLVRGFAVSQAAGRHLQIQCLEMMHRANLQRVDRCSMRHQLEVREPFLDMALTAHALGLDRNALVEKIHGAPRGKAPLRAIYDLYPRSLPSVIRDRSKLAFSEGAGLADSQAWTALFEDALSDRELADGMREFADFHVGNKEELFYLRALSARMDVSRVPHLKSRLALYDGQELSASA
ncbi:MAG: hypothetical protein JO256_01775 [Alphaproteobacteria bacterium]|nr:hypothetical protein [Alphaproteobacteria bacterium]